MDYVTLKLGVIAILLAFSGFFSASEAAFFSLSTLHLYKMREEKFPFIETVERLLSYPRKLLVTILVGNESVNVTISALSTTIFIYFLDEPGKWVAIAVTTIILVIFGEAIPKTFAVTYPLRFSAFASPLLAFAAKLMSPVVWVLERISDFFVSFSEKAAPSKGNILTEEDFKILVDAGHEEGALEATQKELIHRVFDLADIKVSDVMTPRVDMFCLPVSMGIREMEREIARARFSRIPIYGADRDDIIGILHAKHLLAELARGKKAYNVKALLKKPYFVPDEKEAHSMLTDFKLRRMQMAIVVDEYGGVAGLVTITDIVGNLLGDFSTERGHEAHLVRPTGDGSFIASGMMDIEAFNERFGTSIATEEFDTVGGFVLHLFGALPAKGDRIAYESLLFTVEKIKRARIIEVRVTGQETPDEG